jgi:predicted amino acid-binding ACT domain protein
MIELKTEETYTTANYVVVISGENRQKILPEMIATINKYKADILNMTQEEFEKKSLTYIIIDISNLEISINEFSNRIWLRGNELGFKVHLKKQAVYLEWVRERISML